VSEVFTLRRKDYSLSDEQAALRESFRAYFDKTVDAARVRAAEPLGFDPALWEELQDRQLITMALPESVGGDDAGLVELALLAEEVGRRAVPVPLIETIVAARALSCLAPSGDLLSRLRDKAAIVTIAPGWGDRRLIPAGAIAEAALARRGDELVLLPVPSLKPPAVGNLACAPLGWLDFGDHMDSTVLGTAAEFVRIEREWQVLMAAALVGLGQTALDLGVRYANERTAFGAQIGAFQAIAHPLVDAAIGVEGARRLAWRAAWFADNEPEAAGALAISALLSAGAAAEKAGAVAIHTQGGFGFTVESDVQLFYRRAKGWAVMAGDRRTLLRTFADATLGAVGVGL